MPEKSVELEIAYILSIDIVDYSVETISRQRDLIDQLNRIVRASEAFSSARNADKVVALPTGDGMVLVFFTTPDAPAQCALEVSKSIRAIRTENTRSRTWFAVRMGLHDGPVTRIIDIKGQANVAGAGINEAQRVMDCGDEDHILLSKHIADLLVHYAHLGVSMSDLGECEVKHGLRLSIVNVYTSEVGSRELPEKFAIQLFKSLPPYERAVLAEIRSSMYPTIRGPTEGQLRVSMPTGAPDVPDMLTHLTALGLVEKAPDGICWTLPARGVRVAEAVQLPTLWEVVRMRKGE